MFISITKFQYFLLILAVNPLSCQAYKNKEGNQQRANIKIDVDGSGPLDPFPVTCEFYSKYYILSRHLSDKIK